MKLVVYILGVIAGLSIVIGLYFENAHWPGGSSIMTFSTILSIL
jgi:hypothetical protein